MPDEEADKIVSDPKKLRLKQAQAMLDLFEADSGRSATALDELKEWACAQNDEHLRFRVDQFLSEPESCCIT
jgi:hypothetical protein